MKLGAHLKVSMFVALVVAVVFLGYTSNQLVAQNRALSEQVSELSKQVRDLHKISETVQADVENFEKMLEPRLERLFGYSQ